MIETVKWYHRNWTAVILHQRTNLLSVKRGFIPLLMNETVIHCRVKDMGGVDRIIILN